MLERFSVGNLLRSSLTALVLAVALPAPQGLYAQTSQPKAQQAVEAAVQSELTASNTDKSLWIYRSHDVSPGKDVTYLAVQTRQAELRHVIERWGRPLSPQDGPDQSRANDRPLRSRPIWLPRRESCHEHCGVFTERLEPVRGGAEDRLDRGLFPQRCTRVAATTGVAKSASTFLASPN